MRVLFFLSLFVSAASAEAIVVRGVYDGEGISPTTLDGFALLGRDGTTVTGGQLRFTTPSGGYNFMRVDNGTWDGKLYLQGAGCRSTDYWLCSNPIALDRPIMVFDDYLITLKNVEQVLLNEARPDSDYRRVPIGDANADGVFDSADLVTVFQAGQYDDNPMFCRYDRTARRMICDSDESPATIGNSGWSRGDWDGDMEFDSSDLVAAFQGGAYQSGSQAFVPEPSSMVLMLLGLAVVVARRST